ncbi:MAG: hypothetical protein D6712_06325 [Chloroflexi bacterium]|nr:MAG: hypothetical protein D6712_06325 [Chloroflexota bacterium]
MVKPLTPQEMTQLRDTFNLFDRDGDGKISAQELVEAMQQIGHPISFAEAQGLVKKYDEDGSNFIDLPEFLMMMAHRQDPDEEALIAAFKTFDADGDGIITASELRRAMINLGDAMTDAEVVELIRQVDTDGDGMVNYQEFVRMMTGGGK